MIDVEEADAPPEPSGVDADAARKRPILAEPVAGVGVQRRRVAREVGLEDVGRAVAIVVADGEAHAGLRFPVLAVGAARTNRDVLERAVVAVAIQRARVRVVGDVDIRPPIVVEVERADAEAVGARRARDARRPRKCRRRCRGRYSGTARSSRRSARADRRRPECPCTGRAPTRGREQSSDRSRCSWRRRDRAGRRGRHRRMRSRRPSVSS